MQETPPRGFYGPCGRCGGSDDLALEPGSNRKICVECYKRVRANPKSWCTFVATHPTFKTWRFPAR